MVLYGVVADVDAHLLGESSVVGRVGGCLPRDAELGQRAARHARRTRCQRRTQLAVVKLIHGQTPEKRTTEFNTRYHTFSLSRYTYSTTSQLGVGHYLIIRLISKKYYIRLAEKFKISF